MHQPVPIATLKMKRTLERFGQQSFIWGYDLHLIQGMVRKLSLFQGWNSAKPVARQRSVGLTLMGRRREYNRFSRRWAACGTTGHRIRALLRKSQPKQTPKTAQFFTGIGQRPSLAAPELKVISCH
jgi:hypothetical protein